MPEREHRSCRRKCLTEKKGSLIYAKQGGAPHRGMFDTREKGVALDVKTDGAAKTMATERALNCIESGVLENRRSAALDQLAP